MGQIRRSIRRAFIVWALTKAFQRECEEKNKEREKEQHKKGSSTHKKLHPSSCTQALRCSGTGSSGTLVWFHTLGFRLTYNRVKKNKKQKKLFFPKRFFQRLGFPKPIFSKIGYATTDRGKIGLEKPFLQDRFFQKVSQNRPNICQPSAKIGKHRPRISQKSANIGRNRQPHSQNRPKISQMHWPVIGHPLAIHWLPFAIHWPSIGLRSPSIGQPVAFIRHLLASHWPSIDHHPIHGKHGIPGKHGVHRNQGIHGIHPRDPWNPSKGSKNPWSPRDPWNAWTHGQPTNLIKNRFWKTDYGEKTVLKNRFWWKIRPHGTHRKYAYQAWPLMSIGQGLVPGFHGSHGFPGLHGVHGSHGSHGFHGFLLIPWSTKKSMEYIDKLATFEQTPTKPINFQKLNLLFVFNGRWFVVFVLLSNS